MSENEKFQPSEHPSDDLISFMREIADALWPGSEGALPNEMRLIAAVNAGRRTLELIAEAECDHDPELRCSHCMARATLYGAFDV